MCNVYFIYKLKLLSFIKPNLSPNKRFNTNKLSDEAGKYPHRNIKSVFQ